MMVPMRNPRNRPSRLTASGRGKLRRQPCDSRPFRREATTVSRRRPFVLAGGLLSLLLAGCQARPAVACEAGTRPYVSRDRNFAFCYPRDWEAREGVRAYDVVVRPAADWSGSGPIRYVGIDTGDVGDETVTAFSMWHIALWERNPRYDVLSVGAGERFGGEEAYRVMVRGQEDGRPLSATVLYAVRGGKGYRWTHTVQTGSGDFSDPPVAAMEASFRFLR